jgi:hypothetical protein
VPRSYARIVVVVGPVLGILAVMACTQDTARVGPGGECFVATDCEPGLVCVPQQSGARVCSNDLSRVAGRPPQTGPRDSGEAGDGDPDGEVPDGDIPDAPTDTGNDTGNPVDAGADG